MGKSNKGGQFERDFSRALSMWWSDGKYDDLFWRTSQSGGRATQRAKSGKRTTGAYGDITATEPDAMKLIDLCTIELKRGYPDAVVHSLLDCKPGSQEKQPFQKFLSQTWDSADQAGTDYWLLVTRRDRRDTLIWMDMELFSEVSGEFPDAAIKFFCGKDDEDGIIGVRLDWFFETVSPRMFRALI